MILIIERIIYLETVVENTPCIPWKAINALRQVKF